MSRPDATSLDTPSLDLDAVSVRYGDHTALHPFTESIEPGSWVGLIGPNGAGKSSLLRAVAGLAPLSGTVRIRGRPLAETTGRERAQLVAYVPQEPSLPADMTVRDYVLLGRTPYVSYFGVLDHHDRAAAEEAIGNLDLADFATRKVGELSGGERQRVVLARALTQHAPVLLLDEPTSALDIGHQQQALELVTRLRSERELTVVSAMHDLTLASIYTDRLVMLDQGRVAARGDASHVLTAERLGTVYQVCVSVDIDPDDGTVIVVPRRGFPA